MSNKKFIERADEYLPQNKGSYSDHIAREIYYTAYKQGQLDFLEEIEVWVVGPNPTRFYRGIDDEEGFLASLKEFYKNKP